jgi:anti-sigma B factor antagonist
MLINYEVPQPGLVVLTVRGEVDIYSAPAFKEALYACLELHPRRILVDMGGSTFIDSTGLGVLLSARKHARDCRLAVVCGSGDLERVFTILGLERVLDLYATRADAADALALESSVS